MTFVFGPKTRFLTVLATLTDIDASFFAAKKFGEIVFLGCELPIHSRESKL